MVDVSEVNSFACKKCGKVLPEEAGAFDGFICEDCEEVDVKLKPFEVRTLVSLAFNEYYKLIGELREGKVAKVLIPAQESLAAEVKEMWLKFEDLAKTL